MDQLASVVPFSTFLMVEDVVTAAAIRVLVSVLTSY